MINQRVAIVTEAMISPGGGDRYLLSLLKIYPNAHVYIPIWNKQLYVKRWKLPAKTQITTFMQLGSRQGWQRRVRYLGGKLGQLGLTIYGVFAPIFYESLDLSSYELVISVSARFAHGVVTGVNTTHVNIYLTPARYEWHNDKTLTTYNRGFMGSFFHAVKASWFRVWDWSASKRADINISISCFVQQQVEKYYRCSSHLVYPAIPEFWFEEPALGIAIEEEIKEKETGRGNDTSGIDDLVESGDFFLVVSRLYDYKRVDLAIRVCQVTGSSLIIVGDGPEMKALQKLSVEQKDFFGDGEREFSGKIYFTGYMGDEVTRYLYKQAKALLFCGIEDFGLVPVEAMAQGCPVVSINEGGVSEIVQHSVTGYLFNEFSDFVTIIATFDKKDFKKDVIIKRARSFSQHRFEDRLTKVIYMAQEPDRSVK